MKKSLVGLHLTVSLEEYRPGHRARWHAQFCHWPHGYFRGGGRDPVTALRRAWRQFRALTPRRQVVRAWD